MGAGYCFMMAEAANGTTALSTPHFILQHYALLHGGMESDRTAQQPCQGQLFPIF